MSGWTAEEGEVTYFAAGDCQEAVVRALMVAAEGPWRSERTRR